MVSLYQRRWPLGWLYVLTLGLAATLAGRLVWVFVNGQNHSRITVWHFLPLGAWLLLAGMGLLALVMGVVNGFQRRTGRTLAWLGLSGLALGSCAATVLPVVVTIGGGVSVGDPPGVYDQ